MAAPRENTTVSGYGIYAAYVLRENTTAGPSGNLMWRRQPLLLAHLGWPYP
jgi:hypothetical protein